MYYPGPNLSPKEIILQAKYLISRPRATRGSEDDEEERQPLVIREHPPPQPFRHLPPLPQLEFGSSPTSGLDDVALLHRYFLIVKQLLSSLPFPTRLLDAEDLRLEGGLPAAAGGFTDILEATHEGRRVVLKVHRCYSSFDVNQVATVRCGRRLFKAYC